MSTSVFFSRKFLFESSSASPYGHIFFPNGCIKVGCLAHAITIHAHVTPFNRPLCNFLTRRLLATGHEQHQISPTAKTLSSQIALTSECGRGEEALCLRQHIQRDNLKPSTRMFINLFKACGSIPDLAQGRRLHEEARKKGFISDIYIGNTLISMYGKCGAVQEAEEVFYRLPQRTIVSWNVMLSVYGQHCQQENIIRAYRQMQEEGPNPDARTLVLTLQACGALQGRQEALLFVDKQVSKKASFEIGQAFHSLALKKGLARNAFIGSTLVSLYGKCGAIAEAETTFDALPLHSIVSWTAMLSTYVENNKGKMALLCYKRMHEEGLIPDKVASIVAFQACSIIVEEEEVVLINERSIKVKAFEISQALHADACDMSFASDMCLGTSIISMYGKCGAIAEAEEAFRMLPHHDIVSWNAMLSVYAEQGDGEKALCLYKQMQEQSLAVDEVTLIYALQACSEQGSLEVCKQLHFHIVCVEQRKLSSLIATLVHTYGSCGCMLGAQAIFNELADPDLVVWSALLSGYASEGNDAMSLQLFGRLNMASILPDDGIFASILTACSHGGLVFEALECVELMIRDHKTAPKLRHYGVMTDLLGRVGEFKRVCNMLDKMPMQADLAIWWFLLGACRTHNNLELAEEAFGYAVTMQPKQATAYMLMSYIYSAAGLPNCVREVENLRHKQGLHWLELD